MLYFEGEKKSFCSWQKKDILSVVWKETGDDAL